MREGRGGERRGGREGAYEHVQGCWYSLVQIGAVHTVFMFFQMGLNRGITSTRGLDVQSGQ